MAADTGLGAVLAPPGRRADYVTIKAEEGFNPFAKKGALDLRPDERNEDPSVTFLERGDVKLVVIAGGRNPGDLRAGADHILVYALGETVSLMSSDRLLVPRYGHAAVALPVPESSSILGAVLFIGGMERGTKPAVSVELLVVERRDKQDLAYVRDVLEQDRESLLRERLEPRAVYVPHGEGGGFVVVTGGELSDLGSIDLFRVSWPPAEEGGASKGPQVSYRGTSRPPKFSPPRLDHTLTCVQLPSGEHAALLFGGRIPDSSIALPYLILPARAEGAAGPEEWIKPIDVSEDDLARHGHRAVFLPRLRRAVILGGEVRIGRSGPPKIPVNAVIEFNPETNLMLSLRGSLHLEKTEPELVILPESERVKSERIMVIGGRDGSGNPSRTVEVYQHPAVFFSYGRFLPEEVAHASACRVTRAVLPGLVYLVARRGGAVWTLDPP